ncbi:hypothetical protein SeMB42_g05762 [Synchytrium endobioticum]|uniref:Isochorismatase-like domain-containing protein n=1 Tax=Synchytrium endobioticum TaxID=286115 RepID=A0A507CPI6_9FUNG|nr:hypothetical protein SeMB42_g05762 [Synchytrium endobioticum]
MLRTGAAIAARFRAVPESTAFFVCDIQEKFRRHIYEFRNVINTASKMARVAQELQIPVIATEQSPERLGPTVSEIDPSWCTLVLPKTRFSMCTSRVTAFLHEHDIQTVVLFGIEAQAHICITQTCLDLRMRMPHVHAIVLADGCSSINRGEIPIALAALRDAGCTVSSSEAVVFQLLRDAAHPKFGAVLRIVKEYGDETSTAVETFGRASLCGM